MDPTPRSGPANDSPTVAVPEWLGDWTRPIPAEKEAEPWYYGFLERYAKVWLAFGIVAFCVLAFLVLIPVVVPAISWGRVIPNLVVMIRQSWHVVEPDVAASFVRLVAALVLLALIFLTTLLPALLGVASLLLAVDAARNLRALRRQGPRS